MKATREQAIQDMIRAALKREDATINWPYGPTEILYGKDAATATVLAALKPEHKDRLFHIGCSGMVTGDDILGELRKQFPESRVMLKRGADPMAYPGNRPLTDLSRAEEQLGFVAEYTLDKSLVDYAETLRKLEGSVAGAAPGGGRVRGPPPPAFTRAGSPALLFPSDS